MKYIRNAACWYTPYQRLPKISAAPTLVVKQRQMKKTNGFLFLLIFWLPLLSYGQRDTVSSLKNIEVSLPTINVIFPKIRVQAVGGQSIIWRSDKLRSVSADNVAELLATEGNVFIKSYGLNSLATSSIRGGNAGHTLVLWNGFPIQSPMLGLLDLSLLPTQSAEEIILEKGGNTALWGSGAVGGIVALNNKVNPSRKTKVGLQTTIGAFGEWQQQGQVRFNIKNFQSISKFSHHQAVNDFYYPIAPGFPDRQQTNARFSQQNFLQDFYWYFKSNQQLFIHFWNQKSDREIPPTAVQNSSQAHQDDLSNRLILDWQSVNTNSRFNTKVGFFKENLNYFDDATNLIAKSNFTTFLAELSGQWSLSKQHKFSLGLTHSNTRAEADGYQTPAKDYRSALFGIYRYDIAKWQMKMSLRQEVVAKKLTPLSPSIGINYQCFPSLAFKFKAGRNYRLPTLNDRFWVPGGNEDLKAESGWSQELTLLFTQKNKTHNLDFSITAFNKNINNWILWSIKEGQSFWSANNITEVWSRGLEPRLSYLFNKKNNSLRFTLGYDYIRSTNQVKLQRPNIEAGEQLIYTPIHQASGKLSFKSNKLLLSYQHQYTGATQGLNEAIEDYHTGDFRIQYDLNFKLHNWRLFFNVNNLWDANYYVIDRRPMPGRHWQCGINVQLHSK